MKMYMKMDHAEQRAPMIKNSYFQDGRLPEDEDKYTLPHRVEAAEYL